MTTFGVYLVCFYIFGAASSLYYIGRGRGLVLSHGELVLSLLLGLANLAGILYWGTGLGA